MNEDTFNLETRKFLKKVGVTSQREIERAVREAIGKGQLSGTGKFAIKMTIESADLELNYVIDGNIALE